MDDFPFDADEWAAVAEASSAVVNATILEDDVLRESRFAELQLILQTLSERYGEHPVLIETEADFTNDAACRRRLYVKAVSLAELNCLPTYTIRISLASLLRQEFNEPETARNELLACENEVMTQGDKSQQDEWQELVRSCELEQLP
jgi:hypothetical protein